MQAPKSMRGLVIIFENINRQKQWENEERESATSNAKGDLSPLWQNQLPTSGTCKKGTWWWAGSPNYSGENFEPTTNNLWHPFSSPKSLKSQLYIYVSSPIHLYPECLPYLLKLVIFWVISHTQKRDITFPDIWEASRYLERIKDTVLNSLSLFLFSITFKIAF